MSYQSFTTQQKWSIVRQVEASADKKRELIKLGIPHSTYYAWKQACCAVRKKTPRHIWNQTPERIEARIVAYRTSNDPYQQSPARILEQLENHEGYLMSESGVKSVLVRKKLNGFLKPKKKHYYIHPKAEKFMQVLSIDDVEFERLKPRDTYVLNCSDEASYYALDSRVLGHRVRSGDIIRMLKRIRAAYGRYPAIVRLDNARAHLSNAVKSFCEYHGIELQYITKGCPEENWPVESFHRNLNRDVIYRHGYETLHEWQKQVDMYRNFHNTLKRLRSDPIQRTPAEIAFAYTTPMTQARLKLKLQRKHYGQTAGKKYVSALVIKNTEIMQQLSIPIVSKMCVS